MEKLEISLIRLDGGTQPRADHSQDLVDEYADAMQAGATFPPITVFSDGTDFWLADGFHRIQAASNLGFSEISVEIIQGNLRDAVLYSTGVNATHGLRRSNDDKRKAVFTLLLDHEWSQWSDREISRKCGVSNRFVSNLRKEVTVNGSQSLLRKGRDGRTINTSKIGKGLEFNKSPSKARQPSDDIDTPTEKFLDMLYDGEDNLFPIIDITAETIADDSKSSKSLVPAAPQSKQSQIPHIFKIGDRVRIIRRQNGQDKWTGYIGNVWEITLNGWLRVAIKGKTEVRFTLHPDWVELFEELEMTEPATPQTVSELSSLPKEEQLLVRIPLEIEGTTVEVDGIINEVEVHYTHQGVARTTRVPANLVFQNLSKN